MLGLDPNQSAAFLLFAAVSPMLIALLKQVGFSSAVNSAIALVCYIVVGVAGALLSGMALTIENAVPLITIAATVGTAAYNLFWTNFGEQTLQAKTSFVKGAEG